jgi:formate hydrogenlyase subunit 6/NADH:ubiquinone oxidoreductase subunit I
MGRFSLLDRILIPTYDDRDQITPGEVVFDYGKCTGCSICVEACPADTILFEDKRPHLKPRETNECMSCGDCAAICPEGAIRISKKYRFTKYFKTIDQGELQAPRLFEEDEEG